MTWRALIWQSPRRSGPVENFTIDFDQAGGGCTLQMKWENTQASVKVAAK